MYGSGDGQFTGDCHSVLQRTCDETKCHLSVGAATDGDRSTLRDGHRLCNIKTSGRTQTVLQCLIPSDVGKVSTVLPSINKIQFVLFHVSRLTASVSQ
jgi:hypothetical protein